MRDTLLLVLAAIGGTSVILTGCLAMWVAGNACVDRYDRVAKQRADEERAFRAAERWTEGQRLTWSRQRPNVSWKEGFARYSSVDELIAESGRRAGARGESDG